MQGVRKKVYLYYGLSWKKVPGTVWLQLTQEDGDEDQFTELALVFMPSASSLHINV